MVDSMKEPMLAESTNKPLLERARTKKKLGKIQALSTISVTSVYIGDEQSDLALQLLLEQRAQLDRVEVEVEARRARRARVDLVARLRREAQEEEHERAGAHRADQQQGVQPLAQRRVRLAGAHWCGAVVAGVRVKNLFLFDALGSPRATSVAQRVNASVVTLDALP